MCYFLANFMKSKIFTIIVIAGAMISFPLINSCQKEEVQLNFSSKGNLPEIVIHGAVLSIPGKQFVRLSKPKSTEKGDSVIPVSGAEIILFDGINEYLYQESVIDGEYFTIDSVLLIPGKEYTLNVVYNGKRYFAKDVMLSCNNDETLPINEITYDNTGRVYTHSYTHNFGFNDNNIWILNHHFDSTGVPNVYLSPKTIIDYPILLFTHNSIPPQGIFSQGIVTTGGAGEPDEYEEYIKLSVSDNYYKYLFSMFNLTDWASGIFSTIPGNASTNISEGGAGYFFASDVKKFRMKFKDLTPMDK